MTRLAEGPDERDRGMTLIELIVAMSLLAIAMTMLTAMVVSASRSFTEQEAQTDSTNRASIAMQNVTQVIRGGTELELAGAWQAAPVFSAALPTNLTMNAYVGVASTAEGPTRVSLAIDAASGELVETRFASSRTGGVWVYSSTPSRTRVLANDVSSSAPFTYLRADCTPLPSRALTEPERREIAAVRVALAIQSDPSERADETEVVSTVALPNVDVVRAGESCEE